MSYRNATSRYRANVGNNRTNITRFSGKNYVSEQSGKRRHDFVAGINGTPAALLPNEYLICNHTHFDRTFSGTTNDVDPTPTASNNFQSNLVMNGSAIRNFKSKITIKNNSATNTAILDVYQVAMSFYDVLVWNTIFPTACPFTFDSTSVGPPDERGKIGFKAITPTLIIENTINNFKFLQHYIKKVGQVTVSNQDNQNVTELNVLRLPPKVKRSQTGMLFATILHNNSDVNGATTQNLTVTQDIKFDEIPSSNRLPFIE